MRASIRLLVLGLLSAAGLANAEALSVMGFAGSSNWPLFVAQEKGFFRQEGLESRSSPRRHPPSRCAG
jgi:ABC-type nitrate/sulfonate/bicarbonate transport systems, periplasmic components